MSVDTSTNSSASTTPNQTQTADVTSPIVDANNPQVVVESPVASSTPANPGDQAAVAAVSPPTAAADGDPASDKNADGTTKTTPEWAQKRINELTAQKYAAQRAQKAAEDAKAASDAKMVEVLAAKAGTGTPGSPPAPAAASLSEADVERRAQERAVQIAATTRFNEECNKVAESGKTEYKDSWVQTLTNLNSVGATGEGSNPEFLSMAIELNNPHKILHHLGNNPELAAKIVAMPPTKMALELARIEATVNAPKAAAPAAPVSNAPSPIIPVQGAAKGPTKDLADPTLTTEEFMALRAAQLEAKRQMYRR
jgi:hypothetical protein